MRNRLTSKQKAFVEAYLRLQNGTAAYREAYRKAAGEMSDQVAAQCAYENLRKPDIANAIAKRQEQLQLLIPGGTVEELCTAWTDEIRFDIAELFDESGCIRTPDLLSPKARRILQGVEVTDKGEIKYKLPDRQKAKIELGKRIGFYPDPKVGLSVGLDEASAGLVAAALDKLAAGLPRGDLVKR